RAPAGRAALRAVLSLGRSRGGLRPCPAVFRLGRPGDRRLGRPLGRVRRRAGGLSLCRAPQLAVGGGGAIVCAPLRLLICRVPCASARGAPAACWPPGPPIAAALSPASPPSFFPAPAAARVDHGRAGAAAPLCDGQRRGAGTILCRAAGAALERRAGGPAHPD